MPPVSDIFNRSRSKKIKEEEEIERQKEALNRQLDQHKKDIRLQREKTLNELTAIYENAKEQVVIWHQGEVAAADRSYNQEQAEFTVVLNEVAYFREHETRNINEQFNINRDQLLQNKQAEEKSIAECFVQVTKISSVIKEYHETATCKLEKLQIQTANETLGENFRLAYQKLKQSNYHNLNKTKNYTLLVGYVQQLTEQHVISDHDFQHYAGFFSALLDGKTTANDSFTKADLEVSKLLQDLDSYDAKMVLEAYQEDGQSQKKLYRQATEFSQLLQEKVVVSQKDIDAVYNKRSLDLIAEHIIQQEQLENSYQELLQQIATSKDNSQTKFDAYVASLNDSKVLQLITLESQALQEKNKVDFQCQLALQQIDQVLRTELDQINAIRDVRIKSLKKASKYKLINSITTIVSGALVIFSGGALTGVSAALVEAVQTSLAAISLGSLERFVNNKPRFGVEFRGKLAFAQPEDYHGGQIEPQTTIHSPTLERSTNLQVVRERLKQFKQGVKINQTTAENKLFYQLYKEVLPNNIYLSYLGKTPVSGWRSIVCGTVSNNQFNMYGKNVAIDVLSPTLGVNTSQTILDQVQFFPVEFISNNVLAIRTCQQQQLKSNPSWMNSILSFPTDLLFGQMAYADGMPQSSDSASSTTENQQPRARFNLPSQFPAHSNDTILEYVYTVGKGIEQARDAVTDLALHPVDNFKELSLMSWDGYNAMFGLLFGYSTTASRARNAERGAATIEAIDYIKQADSAKKLEIGSAIIAGSILGSAVASTAGKSIGWGFKQFKTKGCARNNFGISSKLESSSFTPTFDRIQSFSVKSVFDGAPYPKEKLLKLVDYLERRNVYVHGTNGRSKFVSMWDGSSQIYWSENPKILEVKHELSHYLDFKKLGLEKYMVLSTHERECLVLERLQNNRVWSALNDLEKRSSVAYVEKIKEAELNNITNTMRHTYE